MKKMIVACLLAASGATWTPVQAAEPAPTSMTVVSARKDPLPVYAGPGDANPSGAVAVVGLPWVVKEARSEFFRVNVDGKDVWIDSMMVRATQKVAARCASDKGTVVAAELGASSERCR